MKYISLQNRCGRKLKKYSSVFSFHGRTADSFYWKDCPVLICTCLPCSYFPSQGLMFTIVAQKDANIYFLNSRKAFQDTYSCRHSYSELIKICAPIKSREIKGEP